MNLDENSLRAIISQLVDEAISQKLSAENYGNVGQGGSRGNAPDWFDTAGGGGGGLDLSQVALGYKINPTGDDPDLVRIYAGEIDRIAVGQTDLTVGDNGYVYVRRTIADNTMFVATAASVPADDVTYKYYRLYQFTVTDGVASLKLAYRPFDIEGQVASGFTGTVTCIGAIQYSSSSLQYKIKTLTYANGLLTVEPTMGDWITLFTASTGCPA